MRPNIPQPLRAGFVLAAVSALSSATHSQVLTGDVGAVSSFGGGTQTLTLDAGEEFSGATYFVVGSLSGTQPGVSLEALTIPLNFDAYFQLLLNNPNSEFLPGSVGVLDGDGRAQVAFSLPPLFESGLPDLVVNHAFVVRQGTEFVAVSNALPVELSVAGGLVVESPADRAIVGTSTIDVEGRLPAAYQGVPGASVSVGGAGADILSSPSGFDRFAARELRVPPGVSSIMVSADAPGLGQVSTSVTITHQLVDANNVVLAHGRAYSALGSAGFAIVELSNRGVAFRAPPAGTSSVDDLSIDGELLFALDAAGAGNLSVFDLEDPDQPVLVSGPVQVPVGPFAGVSASANRVVTSGGTSLLRVHQYSATGVLSSSFGSIDLGIGQPDVLVAADGQSAYVSTDFAGTFDGSGFGITLLGLNAPPAPPTILDRIGLVGAGFSAGSMGPANFPIECALLGDFVLTAHGGGLSVLMPGVGTALTTLPLPFGSTSVDAYQDRAYVVGQSPPRSLAVVDVSTPESPTLSESRVFAGPGFFTGVATDGEVVVVAANAGGLLVVAAD